MLLVEYARSEIGLPMRGLWLGKHWGYTTDEAKRDAFVAAGGHCSTASTESGRVTGYELTCRIDSELALDQAA